MGATNKIAFWLSNLAETLRSQGKLNAATSALLEALGIDLAAGNKSEMAFEYGMVREKVRRRKSRSTTTRAYK